jgi:hypothetical protein
MFKMNVGDMKWDAIGYFPYIGKFVDDDNGVDRIEGKTEFEIIGDHWNLHNLYPQRNLNLDQFWWSFIDPTGKALTSVNFPVVDYSLFKNASLNWNHRSETLPFSDKISFYTTVNQVTSPVPEPTTMLLFGSGLVGLVGLSRKFRKKQ